MASFEFEGKTIRLIPPREITLGDLQFMREHWEIAGQVELEQGMGDVEPAAWQALIVASIRQAQPGINPKVDVSHIAPLPLLYALNEELAAEEEAREKAAAARPTKGSKSSRDRSGASKSA